MKELTTLTKLDLQHYDKTLVHKIGQLWIFDVTFNFLYYANLKK